MHVQSTTEINAAATFGRRKIAPRACVADEKPHVRSFFEDALEELGFVASDCDQAAALPTIVLDQRPDLVLLGLSGGGIAAPRCWKRCAASTLLAKFYCSVRGPR
jgi:hypothetical protein